MRKYGGVAWRFFDLPRAARWVPAKQPAATVSLTAIARTGDHSFGVPAARICSIFRCRPRKIFPRGTSLPVNVAVRTAIFSRWTGWHCAVGLPRGSTPLKLA
jgi:hypothetical protein